MYQFSIAHPVHTINYSKLKFDDELSSWRPKKETSKLSNEIWNDCISKFGNHVFNMGDIFPRPQWFKTMWLRPIFWHYHCSVVCNIIIYVILDIVDGLLPDCSISIANTTINVSPLTRDFPVPVYLFYHPTPLHPAAICQPAWHEPGRPSHGQAVINQWENEAITPRYDYKDGWQLRLTACQPWWQAKRTHDPSCLGQ